MRSYLTYLTLLAVAALSGSLAAQYVRTETAGTYTERTGNGASLNWLRNTTNGDDNAALVNLPFTFSYFDRTYTQCIVSTNGRVMFHSDGPFNYVESSLAATVPQSHRNAIYGIATDLKGTDGNPRANLQQFNESGRVVFQWKNIGFFDGSRHVWMNFQVHLLSSGNIEMVYGPEFLPTGFTETVDFCSGIVNLDGSASFAGFGNVLTVQSARPANGTTVTLAYTAPTMADFVRMTTNDSTVAPTAVVAPSTNTPILSFRLSAVGAGNTVTSLFFSHVDFGMSGISATYALVRDTGTVGAYNGETPIGTVSNSSGAITVSGLTEAVTTGLSYNYLLLITLTSSGAASYDEPVIGIGFAALPAGSVSGCAVQENVPYAGGPFASVRSATNDWASQTPMLAGSTNNVIHASQIVRDDRSPSFRLDSLEYTLTFGGTLTSGSIANLRWYRDNGTPGVFDGKDTLLVSIPSPATTNTFTYSGGISIGTGGVNFLLTVDILGTFTGNGTLRAEITDGDTTPSLTDIATMYGSLNGSTRQAFGTTPAVILTGRPDVALSTLPVQPSDTDVPALAFALRTNSGTSAVTALTFAAVGGATSFISGASLVVDNNNNGRLDGTDTPVTGTLAVNAADITVTAITGQTVGTTATNYLLAVTYSAGAMPVSRQFSLAFGGITSAIAAVGNTVTGTQMNVGLGTGLAGVNVTISFLGTSTDVGGTTADDFFRMTVAARGTGGTPPYVLFSALSAGGGLGNMAYQEIVVECYLEGAGTLGALDATDRLTYTYSYFSSIDIAAGEDVLTTGQTLNYLFRIRRSTYNPHTPHTGRMEIAWRGFTGGTNVDVLSSLDPVTVTATFRYSKGGGKKDEGGCSTGASDSRFNVALLAGVLGMMIVALRTRRKAA